MKNILLFLFCISFIYNASGQANDCFSANAFCSSNQYTFPNATSGSAPSGPNYGCLGQVPRPIWYYMEIGTAGTIRISIQQTSGDVDFAMWGPFSSFSQGCQQIMSGTAPIQSSYSTSSTETLGIGVQGGSNSICSGSGPGQSTPPAAQVGQVYIVLITNFIGTPGNISFNQTSGTGSANCSIVEPCAIDNFTTNISACSSPTSTYSASGTIAINNPPDTGQLIIRDCNGNQFTIASAPFNASSYPYNLSGLNANGSACSLEAYFSDQASTCSATLTYTAPSCSNPCSFSNITANASCQSGSTYTVSGTLNFSNPPSTGQLIVQDCSGNTQTFNPPFNSPLNYSIANLTPNGASCTVTAHFTAQPSCTINTNYTASQLPAVNAGQDVSICQGGSINLTASGADSYLWNTGETTASISVSPSATTTYTVTGTTNGCSADDQITVTVGNSLSLTMSQDVAICEGDSTTISVSGAGSYLWSNGETNSSFSVSPSITTTYNVTGTDASNCTGTGQVTVTVNSLPVVSSDNVAVCEGSSVQIQATGADTYTWFPATYLSSSTGQTVTFSPGTTTVYTITGISAAGCSSTTTVTATANPNPVVEAGNNITECEGNQIILSATGAGIDGNYIWDNGATDHVAFIPPVGSTVYTVTGITSNGCTGTDFLTVTIETIPQLAFTVSQNQNCAPAEAVFSNTGDAGVSCNWIFDNGKTAAGCGDVTQLFPSPGVYGATLTVESSNGCLAALYQDSMVVVDANPIASFTQSPAVVNTTNTLVNFTNNSSGATSYSWSFGDETGTVSSEASPSHNYPEEVERYTVRLVAVSEAGCTDTVYSSVRIQEDLIFYIPNSFTPDNDEFNQIFQPVFTSGFDPFDYTLIIFKTDGVKKYLSHMMQKQDGRVTTELMEITVSKEHTSGKLNSKQLLMMSEKHTQGMLIC